VFLVTAPLIDPMDLLAALVAARSPNPPGDERAAAGVVRDAARALGLPPPEEYCRSAERPNLLIRVGDGSPQTPRLMLAGHLDTMPPGNLASWQTDPYKLTDVDGGGLAGLGVADMKSGVAAAILAAGRLAADPGWAGGLDLLFVADEENCSDYGMKWLARQDVLRADAAVILEPAGGTPAQSWARLFVAQRGSCVMRLTAPGIPGHSAEQLPAGERAGDQRRHHAIHAPRDHDRHRRGAGHRGHDPTRRTERAPVCPRPRGSRRPGGDRPGGPAATDLAEALVRAYTAPRPSSSAQSER
jgi:acetylornithine deacetylase/succinyl-diaminopimelate desuccinylase-like protein